MGLDNETMDWEVGMSKLFDYVFKLSYMDSTPDIEHTVRADSYRSAMLGLMDSIREWEEVPSMIECIGATTIKG